MGEMQATKKQTKKQHQVRQAVLSDTLGPYRMVISFSKEYYGDPTEERMPL